MDRWDGHCSHTWQKKKRLPRPIHKISIQEFTISPLIVNWENMSQLSKTEANYRTHQCCKCVNIFEHKLNIHQICWNSFFMQRFYKCIITMTYGSLDKVACVFLFLTTVCAHLVHALTKSHLTDHAHRWTLCTFSTSK